MLLSGLNWISNAMATEIGSQTHFYLFWCY